MNPRAFFAAVAVLLLSLYGCAHKAEVPPSAALPAAQGEATASTDENGNTKVRLVVHHVAPPQNLQPAKSAYVVWVETPDRRMYNLGQLKIDEDRDGKITAVTPEKNFRLVITAEDFATVTEPSSQVMLTTQPMVAK